jgi:hypothetical protein
VYVLRERVFWRDGLASKFKQALIDTHRQRMIWLVGFVFLGTGGEVETRRPAKPLYMGSIPIPCSIDFSSLFSDVWVAEIAGFQVSI